MKDINSIPGRLLLAFLILQPLSAQEKAPPPSSTDEVVKLSPFKISTEREEGYRAQQTVVGSRAAKNLADIPTSLSIINSEQIKDLGAVELYQVLKFGVSGVTQNSTIGDDINIRGFRVTNSLRDGSQITTWAPAPLYDVERIEILRGPSAMLTGNNTNIGGTINYVSRRPTAQPSQELQATFSTNNYIRLAGNFSGPLVNNAAFKANYRVTLGYLNADRDKEIQNQSEKFISGAIDMYFGSNTNILIHGYFSQQDSYLYADDFLDISLTPDPVTNLTPARINQYSTPSFSPGRSKDARWNDNDGFLAVTLLTGLTDNASLRAQYALNHWHNEERYIRGITVEADNFTLNRQEVPIYRDVQAHSFQVDFLHKFELTAFKLDTAIGVDGSKLLTRGKSAVNAMPALDTRNPTYGADDAFFASVRRGSGAPYVSNFGNNTLNFSYYIQENLVLLKERVIIVGGLRWFEPGGTNTNFVTNVITDRSSQGFRVHKFGVIVKPLPWISLYWTDAENIFVAALGRTDKFAANDQLGDPFKDQEGLLEEYGLKLERKLNEAMSVYGTLAHFKMSQTNIRTFGPLGNGQVGIIQSEKDSADGWELEVGAQFKGTEGRADIFAGFFQGDSSIAADKGLPYVRQAANFVPKKYSVMARYSWLGGALRGLIVGGGVMDQTTKRDGAHTVDFPLVANMFASYRWGKKWEVQMNLDNLTNERYVVNVYAKGLVGVADPFRARATVKYSW